jgi:hypothetical protein
VILLGMAALGGLGLLTLRLKGGNPPLAFARGHGLIAASGLVVLTVGVVASPIRALPLVSLITLVFGAALGIWMARRHMKGVLIPIGHVFLHILFVVTGYVLLLAARFGE